MKLLYLDMDGVAADWRKFALNWFNTEKGLNLTNCDYLNKHPNRLEIVGEFYKENLDCFLHLEMIPPFHDLITGIISLSKKYEFLICWLSKLDKIHPKPEKVISDKIEWIIQNIDNSYQIVTYHRAVFVTETKAIYANSNSILIDDYYVNTREFEKAGGNIVLLNSEDSDYDPHLALAQLEEILKGNQNGTNL